MIGRLYAHFPYFASLLYPQTARFDTASSQQQRPSGSVTRNIFASSGMFGHISENLFGRPESSPGLYLSVRLSFQMAQ